jgi:hypothetical protein
MYGDGGSTGPPLPSMGSVIVYRCQSRRGPPFEDGKSGTALALVLQHFLSSFRLPSQHLPPAAYPSVPISPSHSLEIPPPLPYRGRNAGYHSAKFHLGRAKREMVGANMMFKFLRKIMFDS